MRDKMYVSDPFETVCVSGPDNMAHDCTYQSRELGEALAANVRHCDLACRCWATVWSITYKCSDYFNFHNTFRRQWCKVRRWIDSTNTARLVHRLLTTCCMFSKHLDANVGEDRRLLSCATWRLVVHWKSSTVSEEHVADVIETEE
jgi:hypothetical protein